jgi:hypothetical protein
MSSTADVPQELLIDEPARSRQGRSRPRSRPNALPITALEPGIETRPGHCPAVGAVLRRFAARLSTALFTVKALDQALGRHPRPASGRSGGLG